MSIRYEQVTDVLPRIPSRFGFRQASEIVWFTPSDDPELLPVAEFFSVLKSRPAPLVHIDVWKSLPGLSIIRRSPKLHNKYHAEAETHRPRIQLCGRNRTVAERSVT
jgi:hypothetical protein